MIDAYTSAPVAYSGVALGSIGPSVWLAVFLAVLILFVVYSIILMYHWFTFSMNARVATMVTILYSVISAVFVFAMLASTLSLMAL